MCVPLRQVTLCSSNDVNLRFKLETMCYLSIFIRRSRLLSSFVFYHVSLVRLLKRLILHRRSISFILPSSSNTPFVHSISFIDFNIVSDQNHINCASSMAEDNEVNPNVTVLLPGTNKVYPAPVQFDDLTPSGNYHLFGRAPWFDSAALDDGTIIQRYVYGGGYLPGGVPYSALRTEAWRRQFSCYDSDLKLGHNQTVASARELFAQRAYLGLARILTFQVIPDDFHVDMFLYRTFGEVPYVDRLEAVTNAQLSRWSRGHR